MSNPVAIMQTSKGEIWIELDRAKAPISVENFISYRITSYNVCYTKLLRCLSFKHQAVSAQS